MSLMKVKKIGVLSVAKIYGAIGAVIGLIIGFFIALFSILLGAFAGKMTGMSIAFAGLGVFAIIAVPIFYGLILFIAGAVGAWIYNIFAGWVGPVEIELE